MVTLTRSAPNLFVIAAAMERAFGRYPHPPQWTMLTFTLLLAAAEANARDETEPFENENGTLGDMAVTGRQLIVGARRDTPRRKTGSSLAPAPTRRNRARFNVDVMLSSCFLLRRSSSLRRSTGFATTTPISPLEPTTSLETTYGHFERRLKAFRAHHAKPLTLAEKGA
jgi:hypothetical protein